MNYFEKYLEIKSKYLLLKEELEGGGKKQDERKQLAREARDRVYDEKKLNPKFITLREEKFVFDTTIDVPCNEMYGIPQTVGTCWFDSTLMAVLTHTKCREIFGPVLNRIVSNKIKPEEPEPGLSLESLLNETRRKHIISQIPPKVLVCPRGKGLITDGGMEQRFLNWIIKSGDIKNIKFSRSEFFRNKKNIIKYDSIRWNKLDCTNYIQTNNPEVVPLLYVDDSSNYFSDTIILDYFDSDNVTLKKKIIYELVSICLSGNRHVISFIKCDDGNWYHYDNENTKDKKKILPLDYVSYSIKNDIGYKQNMLMFNGNYTFLNTEQFVAGNSGIYLLKEEISID